nr:ABC transporter ATP-binding protein [Ameyamaea chiangmaiensis]
MRFDAVTKSYGRPSRFPWRGPAATPVLHGISLTVARGETVGIVGESGSGKSTLGRMALRLVSPTRGRVLFDGHDITAMSEREFRPFRSRVQMIFQDPHNALDPAISVGDSVSEALEATQPALSRSERGERVAALLQQVGLNPLSAGRRPHAFSGGQKQRIGIARALATRPELIVADESVSALDVSVQAHILNLMHDLREQLGLAYLFIAHDLAVVRRVSHRVAVLYRGRIVEAGGRDALFDTPLHPYTRMLLRSVPRTHPLSEAPAPGAPAEPQEPVAGCPFYTRCAERMDICRHVDPPARTVVAGHDVACHAA